MSVPNPAPLVVRISRSIVVHPYGLAAVVAAAAALKLALDAELRQRLLGFLGHRSRPEDWSC